jgi:DNA-binding transcriptional LysR family regulator
MKETIMKDTPNHYEIFLKVVETGNISKASEALDYTQSGISHVISALEKSVGFKLFVRSSNGVALTDNGRKLVPLIQNIVNQQQLLKQEVFDINHQVGGKLRIGSFTSATTLWLPQLIAHFRRNYPDVELEIVDGNYVDIKHWLRHGRIDAGFLAGQVEDSFIFHGLIRDPLLVVMSQDHPLAQKEVVTLDDVVSYPIILQPEGYNIDMRAILNKASGSYDIRYNLRDDISILSFVDSGLGISILPELVLKSQQSDITRRPLSPAESRNIGIATLPTQNSILVKLFVTYMRDLLKEKGTLA